MCVDADRRTPSAGLAVLMAQDQATNALAPQGQKLPQPKGMHAGHDARLADDGQGALAGGERNGRAADAIDSGGKGIGYSPPGTSGGTKPAGIAPCGVDAEAFVVQNDRTARAGVDARPARRLFQVGVNTALGDDLRDQQLPAVWPEP